jgi:hypothetical protein
MDPLDPLDAQQVVIEYARLLERDLNEDRHPARVDSLPHAKPVIKTAICTSVKTLARTGRLTEEMRDYFESAYTLLAEYLESELVDLMTEYRESAEQLAAQTLSARDRTSTPAWRTLAHSSALAGEVARAVADDAERLREEFQSFLTAP